MGVERQAATALAAEIDALLGHLDAEHTRFSAQLAAVAPEHSFGAHNLVDYAYLRSLDLSELQDRLGDLGATRLSTTEPDVRARLKAARNQRYSLAVIQAARRRRRRQLRAEINERIPTHEARPTDRAPVNPDVNAETPRLRGRASRLRTYEEDLSP